MIVTNSSSSTRPRVMYDDEISNTSFPFSTQKLVSEEVALKTRVKNLINASSAVNGLEDEELSDTEVFLQHRMSSIAKLKSRLKKSANASLAGALVSR